MSAKTSKTKYVLLAGAIVIIALFVVLSFQNHWFRAQEFTIINNSQLQIKPPDDLSIVFIGDMMLGRSVKQLTDKYGLDYPFTEIKDYFLNKDEVIGNLEGPIMKDAPDIPNNTMRFGFLPENVKVLEEIGFTAVSLANNHSLDWGRDGYDQTVEYLTNGSIKSFGDAVKCGASTQYYNFKNVFILGANFTYSSSSQDCLSQLLDQIAKLKNQNSKSLIVVFPHWGEEYALQSHSGQIDIARRLIDQGADLIIGSHPHVTQNIEIYKGKLIFYSLGNFVFDQYFSKDTQEGLIIKLDIKNEKASYTITPIKSQKSKVYLMAGLEKEDFLNALAKRSSSELTISIKQGRIEN